MTVTKVVLDSIIGAAAFTKALLYNKTIGDELESLDTRASASEAEHTDRWDDLRFPAATVNPPGAASDPDRDTTDGNLLFDGASTELVLFLALMPHKWKDASDIKPHVHWSKTTSAAGDVLWRLEYQIAEPGSAFSGSWTALTDVTDAVAGTPDNDTADEHLISSFDDIDMSGITTTAPIIKFKLSRIGGDASDTYNGADAKLLEFDVHYQIDSRGTTGVFADV